MDMDLHLSYWSLGGLIALATVLFCLPVLRELALDAAKDRELQASPRSMEPSRHRQSSPPRRHGPLMLLRLGEVPTVMASTPEASSEVLRANDLAFATRPSSLTMDVVGCGGKPENASSTCPTASADGSVRRRGSEHEVANMMPSSRTRSRASSSPSSS